MNTPARSRSGAARANEAPALGPLAHGTADAAASREAKLRLAECRAVLEHHAKSFALAARLLSPDQRDLAAAVYAYCRRVDDTIDECNVRDQRRALHRLKRELDAIYRGADVAGADQRAFQEVVRARRLPRNYPEELLEGMAMDVRNPGYESLVELLLYCHRVAGVVGLMMCHVLGVSRDTALTSAAHLGIAMQLTNICRDVAEDEARGRLYLPRAMLRAAGATNLERSAGLSRSSDNREAVQTVIRQLLAEAERYYRSAERGLSALPFRAAFAVRVAQRLYWAIGDEIRARDCDPSRGRAVVPNATKLYLVLAAGARHLLSLPRVLWLRWRRHERPQLPSSELHFPADVLP